MTLILAIDTSTETASVALAHGSVLLGEMSWNASGNHSLRLPVAVDSLFKLVGERVSAVESVAVASGPGSFSGTRVGISAAKGIALALGVPLAGVATLDVIALQASASAESVWAVIPAGRSQSYVAHYAGRGDNWARTSPYEVVPTALLAERVAPGDVLAGPGAVGVALISSTEPAYEVWKLARAGFLAELGGRYLEAGGEDGLHTLEPLYLRLSAAEEKREAAAGSAS